MLETTLPFSGKTATIRRPTGHDMVQAELLCGSSERAVAFQMALMSRITMINGKTLPYEDFLDLDGADLTFLGKLDMDTVSASPPAPSSQSQKLQDGDGET